MAQIKKKTLSETYYHQRGWGNEVWIENMPEYCGKLLRVDKDKRGSLHFHVNKLETMYLNRGAVQLRLIDPDDGTEYFVPLLPGDSIQIPRGQVHQIIGIQDSELIEFSTLHEEGDSRRVQKGD